MCTFFRQGFHELLFAFGIFGAGGQKKTQIQMEMENEAARYVELGIFKALEKHEVLVLLSIASGRVFYFFFIK